MNNNIQEPYCSFEVSKLLKEKGFDIIGQKWYSADKSIYYQDEFNNNRGHIPSLYCEAPSHTVAIFWIWVNFGIWIYVGCKEKEDDSGDVWYIPCGRNLPLKKNGQFIIDAIPYLPKETPQEATEAALLYTLQNLIP